MRFVDAITHRHRLRSSGFPATWSRVEVRCPACGKVFVAHVSPREDPLEGRLAARVRLIRTCPRHMQAFTV
jgi:hypothetical protein